MERLKQPSTDKLAAAINKWLIPAAQKEPKKDQVKGA